MMVPLLVITKVSDFKISNHPKGSRLTLPDIVHVSADHDPPTLRHQVSKDVAACAGIRSITKK